MERRNPRACLPTREDAERIIPVIREEFGLAGIEKASVWIIPSGVRASAEIPRERRDGLARALSARGIGLVELRAGEWAFAIRR